MFWESKNWKNPYDITPSLTAFHQKFLEQNWFSEFLRHAADIMLNRLRLNNWNFTFPLSACMVEAEGGVGLRNNFWSCKSMMCMKSLKREMWLKNSRTSCFVLWTWRLLQCNWKECREMLLNILRDLHWKWNVFHFYRMHRVNQTFFEALKIRKKRKQNMIN